MIIDFPRCIEREYPREFPAAWQAVTRVLEAAEGADFAALERRSPGLRGFDWRSYLLCSVARMVRVAAGLKKAGVSEGRVLDFGSYFGNFSLMLASQGYEVTALDAYRSYGDALCGPLAVLAEHDVRVVDFEDLASAGTGYDAALCMGVIEHIPHTPRMVLEQLRARLRSGGALVLDTPNLAYLYTREKLARGESIFCPLPLQYYTEVPFEGHHREFTRAEVEWMLHEAGYTDVQSELFNYSQYGLSELEGQALANHRRMEADPSLRELILATARKP